VTVAGLAKAVIDLVRALARNDQPLAPKSLRRRADWSAGCYDIELMSYQLSEGEVS
jgi:hypothetical protein